MRAVPGTLTTPAPGWFPEAGLGIFVHWGLYSIPAWAPLLPPGETMPDLLRRDPRHMGERLPYAEWYRNAMSIPGSPTDRHHRRTWADVPYETFREPFEAGLDRWDPDAWADLFAESGARYVVMVTKHHDGYCLWPTEVAHPVLEDWHAPRDLVGELAAAVRERGLRFGVYHSTGLDWSVHHEPIREVIDAAGCTPRDPRYVRYLTAQLDELVERYEPSVVWADIGSPPGFDVSAFKRRLTARVPDAIINDRWNRPVPGSGGPRTRAWLNRLVAAVAPRLPEGPIHPGDHRLADFRTPEYSWPAAPTTHRWETTQGLGSSFAHNREEPDDALLAPEELVERYRAIRAAGGNLLLNVGPTGDGRIREAEASRLRHLGAAIRQDRRQGVAQSPVLTEGIAGRRG